MEKLIITTHTLCGISKILSKMGIAEGVVNLNISTGDEKKDHEEILKRILVLLTNNIYKVEEEIIELISETKKISNEEAQKEDIIEFLTELLGIDKIQSFLKSM